MWYADSNAQTSMLTAFLQRLMLQNVALESGGEFEAVKRGGASYTAISGQEYSLPELAGFVGMSNRSPSGFQAQCK